MSSLVGTYASGAALLINSMTGFPVMLELIAVYEEVG